jgi:hypothetical protein
MTIFYEISRTFITAWTLLKCYVVQLNTCPYSRIMQTSSSLIQQETASSEFQILHTKSKCNALSPFAENSFVFPLFELIKHQRESTRNYARKRRGQHAVLQSYNFMLASALHERGKQTRERERERGGKENTLQCLHSCTDDNNYIQSLNIKHSSSLQLIINAQNQFL